MKEIFAKIKNNPLFAGIAAESFEGMLGCLNVKKFSYEKDAVILLSGDAVNFVGLILSGGARVIKEDMGGRSTIVTELSACELFGEAFACAGVGRSPVTVQAAEKSEILFLDYKKIVTSCASACPFHTALIENMLKLIARKNIMLSQKIEILSKSTTREKLLTFFDMHRGAAKRFTIPYNREELARYLCVDRSAMSKELCRMRDEGMIRFQKNQFEIV